MLIKWNIAIVCKKDGRQLDCRWTSFLGSGLLGRSNKDRVFLMCLEACPRRISRAGARMGSWGFNPAVELMPAAPGGG